MNLNRNQMRCLIKRVSMLVAITILSVGVQSQEIPIYRDASKPMEERINDALSRMTPEEAEVVQLYVMDVKASLPRPIKELKGFKKIMLAPGETKEIEFTIGKEALSFYDPGRRDWVVEPGKFQILIGSASNDIRSSATFHISND